jgi:hypothetical protein
MSLKLLTYQILIKILGAFNLFPALITNKDELQALLKQLYPVSSGKAMIRLGSQGDGGYLLPDDLSGIEACFSPGVSSVSEFEKDCAERGMKVFLADKSVEGPATDHQLFHFSKKFIGAIQNDDFMTLENWVASSITDEFSDLLLQIDIEGYEYEVFLSSPERLMKRFRVIIAEFHRIDQLWNKSFFRFASSTFEKILQTHTCVHIHPNNAGISVQKDGFVLPQVMEFTFLRKDHIEEESTYQTVFPHPLDRDNASGNTLMLPKCWYSN